MIIVASNKPKQTNKQYISSICKFGRKIKTGLNNVQAKKNTKQNASNYLNLKNTKNKKQNNNNILYQQLSSQTSLNKHEKNNKNQKTKNMKNTRKRLNILTQKKKQCTHMHLQ